MPSSVFVRGFASCLLACGLLDGPSYADQATGPSSSKCAEIFASLSRGETKANGALPVTLAPRVMAVRSQLASLSESGVVVYAVLPSDRGMAIIRMESAGAGKPLIEETIAESSLNVADFRRAASAAQQPTNRYYQNLVRDEFRSLISAKDDGKSVFLLDADHYGLTAQMFDFRGAILLGADAIERSVRNAESLRHGRQPDAHYAALIGIPHTIEEYAQIFDGRSGATKYPPLDEWSPEWQRLTTLQLNIKLTCWCRVTKQKPFGLSASMMESSRSWPIRTVSRYD